MPCAALENLSVHFPSEIIDGTHMSKIKNFCQIVRLRNKSRQQMSNRKVKSSLMYNKVLAKNSVGVERYHYTRPPLTIIPNLYWMV